MSTASNIQCRKCRRAGEKLFLKGERCYSVKCAIIKRNFPPGSDGSFRAGKLSEYGRQLKEKQKAKRIYGLREKQFRNYFEKALKMQGNTAENMFSMLESRLDNTVYRLGLALSRVQARQLVGHCHFRVNNKKIDIPSYKVKVGDIITLKEKSASSPIFADLSQTLKQKKDIAPWLIVDADKIEGKMTSEPKLSDLETGIDWRVIIEFYSK